MLDKIKQIENRFEEINQLLADPEISKDHIKVRKLIKEQTKIKSKKTKTNKPMVVTIEEAFQKKKMYQFQSVIKF